MVRLSMKTSQLLRLSFHLINYRIMKRRLSQCLLLSLLLCSSLRVWAQARHTLPLSVLQDKIKGGWAGQTIGVTYGGPTEFQYKGSMIPDNQRIHWDKDYLKQTFENNPGLYDDVYMDLTFVDVFDKHGIDAPASLHAKAFAEAEYNLWHANSIARYNILQGILPPASGHWKNNPQADAIDFQIEADFAGLMCPGMPAAAMAISDRIGHIMNYGDGYYGGLYVATMYSLAFVEKDVTTVVKKSLQAIPAESVFYQCISDVIRLHARYPNDWKQTWLEVQKKYDADRIVPQGVWESFNIDAHLNAAYVVIGLLYGKGDFTQTMEISTRCGQDSDCNPATAAGILGTLYGYSKIPAYWKQGLADIEPLDFKYTTISLNKVYDLSYRQALEMIKRNGGSISATEASIALQPVRTAPLEVSHPGIYPTDKKRLTLRLDEGNTTWQQNFTGTGMAIVGRVEHQLTEAQARQAYMEIELWIDGQRRETAKLPAWQIRRRFDPFYAFELPEGEHTLELKVVRHDGLRFVASHLVQYGSKPYSLATDRRAADFQQR